MNNEDVTMEDEIIDICDDDETPEEKCKRAKCINIECKSGDDLEPCDTSFVFCYYNMKKKKKGPLVCKQCLDKAYAHQENLCGLLENHIPLYTASFPNYDPVFVIDSDEEKEEDDTDNEPLPENVCKMIENEIDDLIAKKLFDCDIQYQIKENWNINKNKLAKLSEEHDNIDKRFDELEKDMENTFKEIYENFSPQIRELKPLIIENPPELLRNDPKAILKQPLRTAVAVKRVTRPPPETDSFDVVEVSSELVIPPRSLPPAGPIERPKLEIGNCVYVMRTNFFSSWVRGRIIEILNNKSSDGNPNKPETVYRVRMEPNKRSVLVKNATGRHLAYTTPSRVSLPVGARVIAIFKDDGPQTNNYYSGIIAEPPKFNNQYRYLVFFDDGYAQYVLHENILVVCECSVNVWEDVHPESRDFIKKYLDRYPERPMVKLKINEVVRTEWNGKWWIARVKEIDGSLVKMYFDADERTEWIYRGSTRLSPLYVEMLAAKDRLESGGRHRHSISRRNMPYVEYTTNADQDGEDENECVIVSEITAQQPSRSVARKSTAKRTLGPVDASEKPKQYVEQQHPGYYMKVSLADAIKPKTFKPHQCNESCVSWTGYNVSKAKGMSCLIKPLKFGFQRIFSVKKGKPLVLYLAPCGRRIRNNDELFFYLRLTKSELTVDLFDFDNWVSCVMEYKLDLDSTLKSIKDLSCSRESVPISCVNYVDNSTPDYLVYMTERVAMTGVNLNTDPNFLSGCDCTDGCADKNKCACWQLTLTGLKSISGDEFDPSTVGYVNRRLPERVVTGIYECNSQCKCSHTCLNRVAQHPLSVKLQLYKTLLKGWGIRCLHDIPKGTFICIYAGKLLTEQAANEGGKNYGDEYLAELDYIEVVESLKEDYEADVIEDLEEGSTKSNIDKNETDSEEDEDYDEDNEANDFDNLNTNSNEKKRRYESDFEFKRRITTTEDAPFSDIRTRLRTRETETKCNSESRKKNKSQDENIVDVSDDDDETEARPRSRFVPSLDDNSRDANFKSVRDYYGSDECIYVMDAKNSGNIGRYLNHSCNPNIFVQNVFVDTHDLRFPWVAFFAANFIKAGDELTWDYNYDVGSVPGKVLHCYCGESNCRRRLL